MTEGHVKQAAIVMSVLAAGWLAVELALKPWLGKQRASSDKSEPSAANESSAANVEPTVANDEPAVANDEPAVKEAATTEAQADDAGDDDPTTSSASGFIASWIVKLLLDRGYVVNGTVLSLNDPKEVHHLLTLDGANERLHLFEANLMKEGSFDSAIHGCDGVFHTACPVKLDVSNPQAEMIDPAVKGTLNVLASCAKVPSIKRVVFTSSMASVLCTGRPLTAETVVDDTWFSVPELCEKSPMKWYLLSKTFAEQAAWKFVKEHDIDMVSINPGIVIGPALQPTINASVAAILNLVNGSETYDNGTYGWVHVKDVAEAHILAFETPAASGRYLLNENVHHVSELVKILRELYPDLKVPNKPSNDKPFNPAYKVSKEKVESLGINYIPLEVGLKEAVESLIEKKFISA